MSHRTPIENAEEQCLVTELWTDDFALMLKSILDHAPAEGAYCAGVVTTLYMQRFGRVPSRDLLEKAAALSRTAAAIALVCALPDGGAS